ncbi:MAG: MFS transporter, partial [Chloroflexi bacterium]|nr:MFS transporter [Chloroflexota bacterium]
DRWDRKRVLLAAQAVTTSTHFILGALVLAGVVEPWHVFALAFVTGSALVFNQTSRSSLIPSLVPKDEVLNAVALNTTALNLMRILGPALAGVLLLWGISPVYFVSGILGIWGIIFVSFMEIHFEPRKSEEQTGWLEDLRAGLRFMMDNPAIIAVLGPPLIMFVFGIPYLNVFVPLFAKDVLDLGDSGVGALVAAAGAGALVGSLFIASQRNLQRQGLLLVLFIALFASALIVFSRTTYLPLSIVALMAAASMSTCYMALTNSLLLNMSPPDMHGRVISLMSLDRGLIPAGAALAGALAAKMGPQDGLFVMASICLVLAVLAGLFATPLRRL